MTLNQIRVFTQETTKALHDAGRHADGWRLSGYLYDIGSRPSEANAQWVLKAAQFLAAELAADA
jgi:hypothetical protein